MKSSKTSKRGGRRENAGRKAAWNNKDTITIRVPKVIATQVMELAHRIDSGDNIDFETKSILSKKELVTSSNLPDIEIVTKSISVENDLVTISMRDVNEAIELGKKILNHHLSARHTVAKLISKLYSTFASFEDLK